MAYICCVCVCLFLPQSLMDEFNPSLQKLVLLGNSYVQAFKGKKERKSYQCVNEDLSLSGYLCVMYTQLSLQVL